MHKVESNTFLVDVSIDVFLIVQYESVFYSRQGVAVDNINGKEISVIDT
jgi:hypothetical protein